MAVKGVDLTDARWILAGSASKPHQTPVENWTSDKILATDRAFWRNVSARLAVGRLDVEIPNNTDELFRLGLTDESQSVDRMVFQGEIHKSLFMAFALPYRIPRLVRKNLHLLFNAPAVVENPKANRSAIEAPIALALEVVARKLIDFDSPTSALLLTGSHPTMELTAATIERMSPTTLRIEITAYAPIDPSQIAESLRWFAADGRQDTLFHSADPLVAGVVLKGLEGIMGPLRLVSLGANAAAIGAIRHGGMLQKQLWLGNPINTLEVIRTSPVALGVIGGNGSGEWFWRRVVDKGEKLTNKSMVVGLNPGTEKFDKLVLAECPHPDYARKRWLAQEDWSAAGLLWHEVRNVSDRPESWDLQFTMAPTPGQFWNNLATPRWNIVAKARTEEAAVLDGAAMA